MDFQGQKNSSNKNLLEKCLLQYFGIVSQSVFIDYLNKGKTMISKVVFFFQDNAPVHKSHIAMDILRRFIGFELLEKEVFI